MHRHIGWCSPEQLQTLQRIFDVIWMELRAKGLDKFDGPTDPEALRAEIACRVFGQLADKDFDAEDITQRVLRSFGIQTDCIWAERHSKTRQRLV